MNLPALRPLILSGLLAAFVSGCASPFSTSRAHEVTRERLLELTDVGSAEHMKYVGSDRTYHYVSDTRPGRGDAYKVRSDKIQLKDTFDVGEDSYTLWPWLIEGKLMGTRPQ
jgi:hypothetical protein